MVQPLPPTTSSNDCTSAAQVVVTKATSPPLIRQNNRFFQREQALKQQLQSKTSGQKKKNGFFEYAIQADGSLFAEQQWQENRQKGGSSTIPLHFQHQSRPGGRGVVWTLQRLQQELQNCKLRHEQKQKLPEKPKEVAKKPIKLYEAATGTGTGTVPTHAPSSSPSLEGAASLSSFQANQQQQQQNPPKPYHHQASSSNPYSSANPYAAQTSQQTQPKPRNNNTNTNTGFDDVFGNDGLDDLLADMDDSMFLSQAGKSNPGYGNSSSMAPPPPRSNNPSNLTASFDYGTQQQQPLQDGMSSSSQDVGGIPLCPGHGMPCQVLTSQSAANPGRQFYKCSIKEKSEQCQFFQWADEGNMGGGGGGGAAPPHNNSSFQPSFQQSSYSGNNYSNSNNNNSSFQQMPQGNSFDNSYSASNNNAYQPMDSFNPNSGFGNNIDSDGSGGPLCPGHGLPCQILTSNSASNPGREFYKCSLPNRDEQCDFFEWVDGLGNNNNNNANPNANSTSEFSSSLWNQTRMPGAPPPNPLVGVKNIHEENKRVFGHRKFRPGQREIIENAVAGEDVFVLMPTGGGKSLCYQLPAWCCPGLAVVISPLLSLIQDQVQSMTKLGVEAVFLNSSQDYETEQRDITRRLYTTTADSGVKLLYVTPEKLRHSNMLQEILRQLYNKNLLSRFVVDEAHCMSDWGHDFRPDYASLSFLRENFPNVPLMALTATANEKVVNDAIVSLRMKQDCYRYKSSFNRPNLHYQVRKKDSKTEDSICDYIIEKHKKNNHTSGVIYCLSRKDCEKVSEKLQEKLNERGMRKIRVSYYHAELDAHERERRHSEWTLGRVSVLCATIAFGMGIDKPDVRFVIHYSMPKSPIHYYQESGRAGRDGEKADCILYYSYKDKQVLEGMIKKSSNNPFSQSTRRKIDQLYSCLRYCEDDFRCRRTMQLEFFGETFDRSKCRKTCDNCQAGRDINKRDLTEVAKSMLSLLSSVQAQSRNGQSVTLLRLTELFRGSKAKGTTKFLNVSNLRGYGDAAKYKLKKKQDIDRVAHAMILEKILMETSELNKQGFSNDYVQPGEKAQAILAGRFRFFVDFPKETSKDKENSTNAEASKKKKKAPTNSKKATGGNRKKRSLNNDDENASIAGDDGGLKFHQVLEAYEEDDDDDESLSSKNRNRAASAVLSPVKAKELQKVVKDLATCWAKEEECFGNNVYYWHILSNEVMKEIASQCPTTLEELRTIDGLGEKKIQDYGPRMIRAIQNFVSKENLGEYLKERKQSKRPVKKQKVEKNTRYTHPTDQASSGVSKKSSASAPAVIVLDGNEDEEFDEFPLDLDLSTLDVP